MVGCWTSSTICQEVDSAGLFWGEDSLHYEVYPQLVERPQITYPPDRTLSDKSAKVWIRARLDTVGVVIKAEVITSTDNRFNAHAIQLVKTFRMTPFRRRNHPVSGWISIPIKFEPIVTK
jgi:TonB family protein